MDGDFSYIFWVMQACGAVALVVQNAANFLPCGKRILKMQVISSLLWAGHYGLMGIQNVMIMCLAGGFRNWQSCRMNQNGLVKMNIVHTLGISLFLIISAATFAELFPILMVSIFYFRMIARDNLLKFHFFGIICAVLWTGYHYYNGAWFGVMNDSIATLCASLAFLKVYAQTKNNSALAAVVPA